MGNEKEGGPRGRCNQGITDFLNSALTDDIVVR